MSWENGFAIPNHSYHICNFSYLFSERLSWLGFPSSLLSYTGREGTHLLRTNILGQGVGSLRKCYPASLCGSSPKKGSLRFDYGHPLCLLHLYFSAMLWIFLFVSLRNNDNGLGSVGLIMWFIHAHHVHSLICIAILCVFVTGSTQKIKSAEGVAGSFYW